MTNNTMNTMIPENYYYVFEQNRMNGNYEYDAKHGLSTLVYIQAINADEAMIKAENIGISFDPENVDNRSGCRWYRVSVADGIPSTEVPEKDAVLIRDDNDKYCFMTEKKMNEDEYDVFIHPLDGDFYGAYKEFKHIKRRTAGYGFMFSDHTYGNIYPVGKDGWNKDGNRSAPSPDYEYVDDDELLIDEPTRRLTLSDYGTYTLWTRYKADAETLRERVKAFVDALPKIDVKAMMD